jgi:hypothetical protein
VRALLIVAAPEGLESLGLGRSVGFRRLGHRQHGQMETFMASVLLRLPRLDALKDDAEFDEARREWRQPGDAGRCKW